MGYINFSMPRSIVLKFKDEGNLVNFVETGTYKGGTCYWAAKHFKNIYTIEIDPEISKSTASQPDCPPNIKFYVGNSKNVLPGLVKELSGRTIFWLDGHWCNVSDLGKEEECPILEEIHAIKKQEDSIILIDDARCFMGPLPPPHDNAQWPGIDTIFITLKECFPRHYVTIADDVIYCVPPDLYSTFGEDWLKQFPVRFSQKPQSLLTRLFIKLGFKKP